MSWYEESVVYQVYPLGLTGAPYLNDRTSEPVHRLRKLVDDGWVEHMHRLGATCLLLNPVFESESHGYDTIDYTRVDRRLGTNEDLRHVVDACHEAGIKVLLDGVFNHTGCDSRYFNKYGNYPDSVGAYQSTDSVYRSWYTFHDDGT